MEIEIEIEMGRRLLEFMRPLFCFPFHPSPKLPSIHTSLSCTPSEHFKIIKLVRTFVS